MALEHTRSVVIATTLLTLIFVVGCAPEMSGTSSSDTTAAALGASNTTPDRADDPQAEPGSDLPAGAEVDGKIIIPNGRFISPLGNQITGPRFVINMRISPDGKYIYMVSLADRRVVVFNTQTLDFTQQIQLGSLFNGLALNAAGTKLWVSGATENVVYEFDISDGVLTLNREISRWGNPTGLALSPDESTLYVATSYGNKLFAIDLDTGLTTQTWACQNFPYDVVLNDAGTRAYVSNWGSSTVTIVNTTNGQIIDHVVVGKSPEGIVYRNGFVYVAGSDSDEIAVIDTSDNSVAETIDVNPTQDVFGHMPTTMWLSGSDLYVACSGYNSVAVVNTNTNTLKGHIPTGWYPAAVVTDDAEDVVYVSNAKGQGRGPGGSASSQPGTFSVFDRPDDGDLAALTQEVHDNNLRAANFFTDLDFDSPIPTERGVPSEQIKRVIFVMKENKTYDQLLGDFDDTEADPSLCLFCGDYYLPNTRALARRFTNCDNFFSETEASLMGHMWSQAMVSNDFTEKSHKAPGAVGEIWTVMYGSQASEGGTIFEKLVDLGRQFRVYGQIANVVTDIDKLYPYVNLRYGFWNLGVSDETKLQEVFNDFDKGLWPPLVYISLPNDHTSGGDPGAPTPEFYVADNDAALGKLVEYVSHSPYWNETAIFVMQDDPQSGADHIDAHRSLGLVISPWAKRGYTSHTFYSMSSMWLTIELILGLPSLTIYDKNVAPMYDAFTMTPDAEPYTATARQVPLSYNPAVSAVSEWSSRQIWDVPDQVPNMGEILWKMMRPNDPFPYHLSVDREVDEDEEEVESAHATQYRESVRRWIEYGKARGVEPLKPDLLREVKRPEPVEQDD